MVLKSTSSAIAALLTLLLLDSVQGQTSTVLNGTQLPTGFEPICRFCLLTLILANVC